METLIERSFVNLRQAAKLLKQAHADMMLSMIAEDLECVARKLELYHDYISKLNP